jgi:predicted nucleotidyltransferase
MSRLQDCLTAREEQAIDAFMQRLTAELDGGVTDVLLFGSKARGEGRPDSDLDVVVLVDRTDYAFKHAILWLAAEISLDYDVLLSPRVIPLEAWRKMVEADTLFYRSVASEGIALQPPASRHPR